MLHDMVDRIKGAWLPSLAVFLVFYFSYHALSGDRGLFSLIQLKKEITINQEELLQLRTTREALEHRVSLMNPKSLDVDMLDEQIRRNFGYAHQNEIIIYKDESYRDGIQPAQ